MAGMNPGFAKYLADKKAGKLAPKAAAPAPAPQGSGMAMPPAVFNNVPGLPNVGKRHSKVMHKTAKKPLC